MPRGQKSKLRARERRRQARSETQRCQGDQATASEEEENPSSSSPLCDGNSKGSLDDGSCSKSLQPQRAPPTTATSVDVPCTKSDEGAKSQDEERPSTSQALQTTDHSRTTPLDEKSILLVHFLLHKYNMKEPITKEDMLNYVIKEYKNHFPEILKKASELMVLAFGIDVKETDPTMHCYALVRKLHPTPDARLTGEEIKPKTGLLMTVLCVIFMKGNCAAEEEVWEVLNVMGIYAGRNHFIYGEPQKLITQDLVQERYLEYQQIPNSDPPRYQFLWGPRAHAETSKMRVLEFLAKIHNTVPSAFPLWYAEALRDEEERAQARFAATLLTGAFANAHSSFNASSFSHP